jgi:probable F420-dependent oxidoreductase
VKFALGMVAGEQGVDPRELARAAEAAGFEALFLADHTHIPVSRETPYPMPPYGELPREYYRVPDPLVTLSAIASVTSELKLGTGICLVVERDPIILAKQVATLDVLSGGRVLLGVGAGWNLEEMRNHGTDPRTRITLLRERVEAMKQIWTKEQAEYHGKLVEFDPIFSWPKPVQIPHPPVLIGGNAAGVLDRVVAIGDGWMPGHQRDLDALGTRIEELQEKAAAAGREPIPVTIFVGRLECVDKYQAMGISRVVFLLRPGDSDQLFEEIARYASSLELSGSGAGAVGAMTSERRGER